MHLKLLGALIIQLEGQLNVFSVSTNKPAAPQTACMLVSVCVSSACRPAYKFIPNPTHVLLVRSTYGHVKVMRAVCTALSPPISKPETSWHSNCFFHDDFVAEITIPGVYVAAQHIMYKVEYAVEASGLFWCIHSAALCSQVALMVAYILHR